MEKQVGSHELFDRLLDFLYFGYIPHLSPDWTAAPWANVRTDPTIGELPAVELRQKFGDSFENGLAAGEDGVQIVLLSAGYDSRAILAGLLAQRMTDEIVAVTYGTPRTYDFEIPKLLTSRTGVRHEHLDLSRHRFTPHELTATAEELAAHPMWVFGPHMNRLVCQHFGPDAVYWSGYLGGPATGSHQPTSPSDGWAEALERHAERKSFGRLLDTSAHQYLPRSAFPEALPAFDNPLTIDERVDLLVRQHSWLRREHEVAGYKQRFPFLDPGFLHVALNAGRVWRQGQKLYLEAMSARYPGLFQLPFKDSMGLPTGATSNQRTRRLQELRLRRYLRRATPSSLRWVAPGVNHLDWDHAFRYREDFKELAELFLPKTAPMLEPHGIDPVGLAEAHRLGKTTSGLALTQLVSLGLYLQVAEGVPSVTAKPEPPAIHLASAPTADVGQPSTPSVSVVIPTHDGRASVLTTVEALLYRADDRLEVIVVSDGDGTLTRELLGRIDDPRLTLLEKPKEGANPARNLGLQHAKNEWVAFVDDDDVPRDNWIATWRTLVSDNTIACTAGLALWRAGQYERTKVAALSLEDPTMKASRLMAGAFIVRREILNAVGGYDCAVPAAQNQDLGLRIIDYVNRHRLVGEISETNDVIIDVYVQEANSRLKRYGNRYATASAIFLERYADRMAADPPSRASSLRIIARVERGIGNKKAARAAARSALSAEWRNRQNLRSLALAYFPQLEPLGRRVLRIPRRGCVRSFRRH